MKRWVRKSLISFAVILAIVALCFFLGTSIYLLIFTIVAGTIWFVTGHYVDEGGG